MLFSFKHYFLFTNYEAYLNFVVIQFEGIISSMTFWLHYNFFLSDV